MAHPRPDLIERLLVASVTHCGFQGLSAKQRVQLAEELVDAYLEKHPEARLLFAVPLMRAAEWAHDGFIKTLLPQGGLSDG